MRNINPKISEFELVPSDLDVTTQKEAGANRGYGRRKWRPAMLWRSRPAQYFFFAVPLLLAIVPIILLAAFSSTLSHRLGSNGCTPSGEFVIPYTTSIWDTSRFFAITIAFVGPDSKYCSWSSSSDPSECGGYNFTQVKVIDIAWDILVGRGGQALLIFVAYHFFGRVVKALMKRGEVGYDLFSAVAFNAGSVNSFIAIARHAAGFTPIPRTRRAVVIYAAMAAATLYIVVIPSLLAAMTGYTSYYDPSLELGVIEDIVSNGTRNCFGAILPLWGLMQPTTVGSFDALMWIETGPYPISYTDNTGDSGWVDYYNRYRYVYEACPARFNISDCKQADQATTYKMNDGWSEPVHIPSPMPGMIPYAMDATGVSKYTHWSCYYEIFTTLELQGGNYTQGICQAGSGYAWGFSFLLTFVTSVLTLVFTLIMYGLWFEIRRHDNSSQEVGEFMDAVTMVSLAQRQYGPKIGEWSSYTLQREVVAGKAGMSFADGEKLVQRRKRNVPSRDEQEYGDPRAGDWGGDVYFTDSR